MKTLLRLPISTIKVILALAALPIGGIFMLAVILRYQDYKALFSKKKRETARRSGRRRLRRRTRATSFCSRRV